MYMYRANNLFILTESCNRYVLSYVWGALFACKNALGDLWIFDYDFSGGKKFDKASLHRTGIALNSLFLLSFAPIILKTNFKNVCWTSASSLERDLAFHFFMFDNLVFSRPSFFVPSRFNQYIVRSFLRQQRQPVFSPSLFVIFIQNGNGKKVRMSFSEQKGSRRMSI